MSARDEILASGGSLSHHHGVGKIRSKWYQSIVSKSGSALYLAAKRQLDPKNIFAAGNLLTEEQWLEESKKCGEKVAPQQTTVESSSLVKAKL